MPWSRNSLLESATGPPIDAAESVTFGAATLQDLCSDPNGWTRAICHSIGSLLDIPWLGTRHDGFTSCINLFRYTRIRRDPTMPRSLRDDAALWVSAMTFGLLEAVTRIEMVESNFLVPGGQEGETVISGERILQLLGCWRTRLESETEVAALERGRQVVGLLKEALTALLEESHLESSMLSLAGFSEDEVEDIYAAVAFNVRFLCSIATRTVLAWRTIPELVDLRRQLVGDVMFLIDHKVARSCRRRMRKAGWCPYLLHGLFRNQSPIEMVSRLVQLPPYIKSSRDEHEGCKEDACVLYTITDTDSYVPRHVQPSCHCTYVRPPLAEVLELLTQGVVPVVVSDGAALRINSSEQAPYVAISHVWAEGMGSTTDAGLPTCVVQRIAGLARALLPEPEGAFWMDSLCVPSLRNERKRAIMLMAQTYRDAAKVLVIDDCVRTLCSEGKSWDDNLLRIATSQWVRRVWTLQEGILARELYFEFLEGPVKVDARPRVQGDYSASLVPILSFRADGRESGATRETPLSEVVRLLEGRKTTKEEDELIAISSLLPTTVRIDLLLAERDGPNLAERRMRLFLLQLRQIPNEVPFGVNLASRLSLPGFTWAPRTLVTGLHRAWEVKSGTAICTEQGLVADYCLSPLRTPIPVSEESVYVFHTASKTAYVLVSLNLSASPPAKVNALLFVDGEHTMLQGRSAICIAIADEVTGRSTGVEDHGADGGASRDRPRPVIFAGLYAIRRTSLLREQAVMQGELDVVSELGETRPTWVRVM
ncbi:hypothetical protein BD414DRAFT_483605 [Trametes punicea]|nr:hypothetical protein BD414DRAFT_483605 [Trametes punicea]